jgi:transposase
MSVYVGIDVHRKRSQVAVIDQSGEVLANRNVPNGAEPILQVIGGLPPGAPAAFEAAYGTSWLVQPLEDYGFDPHLVHPSRCKAIASARLKNDKVDAPAAGLCAEGPRPARARRHQQLPQINHAHPVRLSGPAWSVLLGDSVSSSRPPRQCRLRRRFAVGYAEH